jgi:hypothetical protein
MTKNGPALKTLKAVGLAAIAAGVVAAALVASRNTQTGLGAAAAAVGAEPVAPTIADDPPERERQLEEVPVAPAPSPAVPQHARPIEEPRMIIAAPSTLGVSPDKASNRKAVTAAMAPAAASAESRASTPSATASAVSDAAPVASTVAGAAEPSVDDAFGGRR